MPQKRLATTPTLRGVVGAFDTPNEGPLAVNSDLLAVNLAVKRGVENT